MQHCVYFPARFAIKCTSKHFVLNTHKVWQNFVTLFKRISAYKKRSETKGLSNWLTDQSKTSLRGDNNQNRTKNTPPPSKQNKQTKEKTQHLLGKRKLKNSEISWKQDGQQMQTHLLPFSVPIMLSMLWRIFKTMGMIRPGVDWKVFFILTLLSVLLLANMFSEQSSSFNLTSGKDDGPRRC